MFLLQSGTTPNLSMKAAVISMCRGKIIVRHENHPMGTESTLIYNLWIFSWLINLIRRLTGLIFGFGGRVLYLALETYHGQVGYIVRKSADQFG